MPGLQAGPDVEMLSYGSTLQPSPLIAVAERRFSSSDTIRPGCASCTNSLSLAAGSIGLSTTTVRPALSAPSTAAIIGASCCIRMATRSPAAPPR